MSASAAVNDVGRSGRIGPNAIVRMGQALSAARGSAFAESLFTDAGLRAHWRQPPEDMVHEDEVRALYRALRAALPVEEGQAVARAAGCATADYLLAHRIPGPVQRLLRLLPAHWAARGLLMAIQRHAWTFAGSGHVRTIALALGRLAVVEIRNNPLCRDVVSAVPACDYYAATFERLFQRLVHARATVHETACEASGDPLCRFELRW